MTKASKLSDAQKASILEQGNDGVPVAEICRKAWSSHDGKEKRCRHDHPIMAENTVHYPLV